jgi:D-alanyl-D-alanine carboxypeptidase/D-alanyl-D-alanine-endopeptidase (penicillin-binding protein 4)
MRSSRLVSFSVAVTIAAGGGAAYVATRPGDRAASHSAASHSVVANPPVHRSDVLALLPTTGPADPAAVSAALGTAVRDPAFGGSLAGLVVDAATGGTVFARRPDASLPPASTVKLLTAAAALEGLGPDATLSTSVLRSGRTLFLVGGGDMTLTDRPRPGYPRAASLAALARRTAAALGTTGGPVALRYDATAWPGPATAPGWTPGYLSAGDVSRLSPLEVDEARLRRGQAQRSADPAAAAAAAFGAELRRNGVVVTGQPRPASASAAASRVATVTSAPVAALVERMLTVSDNDLAESLGRAAATAAGLPADFAGEAEAVLAAVRRLGVPMTGLRLYDASGLSRLDRVSPRALVAVLRASQRDDRLAPAFEGLPVAGLTGTLADRYRTASSRAGAGVARAKTGTLAGVSALAGQVVDAAGRLLVFAFVTDHAPLPTPAEKALDRLVSRLAACSCA